MTEPELFSRYHANPILTTEDWPYPVNAVFNPAAAAFAGETDSPRAGRGPQGHLTSIRRPFGQRH